MTELEAEGELGFKYLHRPPDPGLREPTLLLLHGTGGSEHDLMDLARGLVPGAAILSPRGQVSEAGAARYFRRLAPGVFDEADIRRRADDMAAFLDRAAAVHGLDPRRVVALGYSNGANMAAAMLLLRPCLLVGAVLLHPMTPLVPGPLPDLADVPVFIGAGRRDPAVSEAETLRVARLLASCRAPVCVHWQPGGHGLSESELKSARTWLRLTGLVSTA
jgi:predicted esterase